MSSSYVIYLNSLSQTISTYGSLALFVLGIFGNFVNIILFTFHRQLNKLPTTTFLVVSFLASQVNLCIVSIPQLLSRFAGSDPLTKYPILCKLRWFFGPVTAIVGLHGFCLAIINQYLLTSKHIRYRQLITRNRSYFICLTVIFYALVFLTPNLFYFTHWINSSNKTICDIINPIAANYNVYIGLVVYCFIPILTLSIFSLLMWLNVRRILVRQHEMEQTMTRLLIGQIIMVLLTTVAFVIHRMYFLYTKNLSKSSLQLAEENVISAVAVLFITSTHWMSFYVYVFTSKTFRHNLSDIIFRQQGQIRPAVAKTRTPAHKT
ncbi:unnamed protein product [Adineta ricciae]|uniref:G-protein coupled receptors family 1 profile domain-containing protein n=1 Tax=Adineta ricciae TaxID=249248 RepID=A0A813T777_ADIRI|nr:unnamed protein product [Adineta ricciae]CAF1379817.1 unnamed protein product [Adineta ricciae]